MIPCDDRSSPLRSASRLWLLCKPISLIRLVASANLSTLLTRAAASPAHTFCRWCEDPILILRVEIKSKKVSYLRSTSHLLSSGPSQKAALLMIAFCPALLVSRTCSL